MQFVLKIKSNNEAMNNDGQPEWPVIDILRATANRLGDGHTEGVLYDVNGNSVGSWKLTG